MTSLHVAQLAFMTSFFSLSFAGVGLYMFGRLFAMVLFRKMHVERACPVCGAPMDATTRKTAARSTSTSPLSEDEVLSIAQQYAAERTDVEKTMMAFLLSLREEQFDTLKLDEEQTKKLAAVEAAFRKREERGSSSGAPDV